MAIFLKDPTLIQELQIIGILNSFRDQSRRDSNPRFFFRRDVTKAHLSLELFPTGCSRNPNRNRRLPWTRCKSRALTTSLLRPKRMPPNLFPSWRSRRSRNLRNRTRRIRNKTRASTPFSRRPKQMRPKLVPSGRNLRPVSVWFFHTSLFCAHI